MVYVFHASTMAGSGMVLPASWARVAAGGIRQLEAPDVVSRELAPPVPSDAIRGEASQGAGQMVPRWVDNPDRHPGAGDLDWIAQVAVV